ncbi:MAG: MraY family glycosyltransferase [Armatimonadota bacterium]|nr:MraY family glycosyltransferase [Armatimonadota bacterium]MDR7404575.1 MraY family glycosyltransferase [Armatimonadota bacterium]
MSIPPYLVAGAIALVVTYAIAYEMRWLAQRLGAVAPPGGRHIHTRPVPRLGGLAVCGGILAALAVTLPVDQPVALVRESRYLVLAVPYRAVPAPLVGVLLGAVAVTLLGAVDDLRALPGRVKFPLIYLAASVPVWFGVTTPFVTHPLGGRVVPLGWAGAVFTVFWLGSMAIAVNSIDGVDGLAPGVAAITGATLLSAAAHRADGVTMTLAASVVGASVGFLRHNFNPARIFLGDSGSMLLGYLLGVSAVLGLAKTATVLSMMVPVLALALPILDTGYAIVRRARRGVSIFLPDREHLHHRLLDRGLSQRQVVLVLWLLSAVCGLGGLALAGVGRGRSLAMLAAIAALLVVLAWRWRLLRVQRPAPGLSGPADVH